METSAETVLDRPTASPVFGNGERANRLKSTRFGGKLVNEYWDNLFRAKEQGRNRAVAGPAESLAAAA